MSFYGDISDALDDINWLIRADGGYEAIDRILYKMETTLVLIQEAPVPSGAGMNWISRHAFCGNISTYCTPIIDYLYNKYK